MNNIYEDIIELYNESNSQMRGYKFESIVRELQPWTIKPPISAIGKSEQLDAVYEWEGRIWIVEAKAKTKIISRSSHDWEDFELKIRNRNKASMGLYLSLYEVEEQVIKQCERLNEEGYNVFVLYGAIWKDLANNPIDFTYILKYLLIYSRIDFRTTIDNVNEVKKWFFQRDEILKKYNDICMKTSNEFLRRYKQDKHEELYVERQLDQKLNEYIKNLFPKSLSKSKRTRKKLKNTLIYEYNREIPSQIILVRDICGAGKTTYAVQNALSNDNYISFSVSASEDNIDIVLEKTIEKLGNNDYGLTGLKEINKPIVFVVDSLDEENENFRKKSEIKSIIDYLNTLNIFSEKYCLYAFPIAIIFTIREDFWREWESLFEGMHIKRMFKTFSEFTDDEFFTALNKYENTYHYKINNKLSEEDIKILSNPLNLYIFSETYKFQGNIEINEIFTANVLHNYFKTKSEEVNRWIKSISAQLFLEICEDFLSLCVYKSLKLTKQNFYESLETSFPLYYSLADELLNVFKSELIFYFDVDNLLVIRHMKFFEYLYADFMIRKCKKLTTSQAEKFLEDFINKINTSKFVDLIEVYNNVKYIYSINQNDYNIVQKYLDSSNSFIRDKLSYLRNTIAHGHSERIRDYEEIVNANNISDGKLLIEAFFVCAAKCNCPDTNELLNLFVKAWKANDNNVNRWKLIVKMNDYNLLLDKKTMSQIVKSKSWKEWQVYLGYVSQNSNASKFIEFLDASDNTNIKKMMKNEGEWIYVKLLLEKCDNNIHLLNSVNQ